MVHMLVRGTPVSDARKEQIRTVAVTDPDMQQLRHAII